MKLQQAGENALIIYFGSTASPEISARVQAATASVERVLGSVLLDLIPSYASLLVIYDPLRTDHLAVTQGIRQACAQLGQGEFGQGELGQSARGEEQHSKAEQRILPVFYDPEVAQDLEALAHRAGLTVEEVIALHCGREYRVYAIGFAPGFAYLGEVDERIAAPRLATPRQRVPRGAVAIADRQTAIYPAPSPGGWNLIGRCPTPMFDPASEPCMPVAVGDRVCFQAIDREQFLALGGELE